MRGGPAIDLATEELAVLFDRLGLDRPDSLAVDAPGMSFPDNRGLLLGLAERSLRARRLIDPEPNGGADSDGESGLVVPLAELVRLVARPGLMVVVDRWAADGHRTINVHADPTVAVEHVTVTDHVHRFTPFATPDLPLWVGEAAGLVDASPSGQGPDDSPDVPSPTVAARLARSDLAEVEATLTGTTADVTAERLGAAGVAPDDAAALARALHDRVASGHLTVVHRPAPTVVAGGDLAWFQTGTGETWRAPSRSELDGTPDAGPLELRRIAPAGLFDEMVSFLPT